MLHPSSIEPQHESFELDEFQRSSSTKARQIPLWKSAKKSNEAISEASPYRQSNLSTGQLQIWMGQNLLPEVPIYNLAAALNIHGEIDPVHFCQAFQTLVNSSDSLRTVLEEIDGIPMQKVLPALPKVMSVIDYSDLPDPRAAAPMWMQQRCEMPLGWQRSLFESALIKLSENEFIWYLNIHHVICDGWSFELIYRQMAELYRLSLRGQLPESLSLFPYADYLAYERAYRESSRYLRSQDYWQKLLSENGDKLSFYGKVPDRATTRVHRVAWNMGPERTMKLRSMAATAGRDTEQASLMEIFATTLIAYLHCLDEKQIYTIGIPFHNRRSKRFKETIGFFSEVLPIRLEVSEQDSFVSLLRKVKTEVFKAARHGQSSVANPLFSKVYDVLLNYHTRAFSNFSGMPAVPQWLHNGHGDDSLAVQISDFGSTNSLSIDFDLHRGIFEHSDPERIVRHFSHIVDAFLAEPDRPLRLLSLVSPEEAKNMLEWSLAGIAPVDQRCVHQIFEERAEVRPDAIAIVFKDNQLSYGELNLRANQLARCLRKRGIGPGALVGLYVERSLEMMVGLLGILKAGAAYVPIHPEYSEEWVNFILTDSKIPILLTQGGLLARLPPDHPELITLESVNEVLRCESDEKIDSGVTADHLAYIIYTSGTTGSPKGVQIPHRALMNFAVQAADVFGIDFTDRVLQFASIAVDTSIEEIFPCLMRGGTLVLRTDTMLESTTAFIDECQNFDITVLDLPTAYWHELTARLFSEHVKLPISVRAVIIGGERVFPERLTMWRERVDHKVKLFNTYGPTETTVAATVYDLTDHDVGHGLSRGVPIGRPILNVQTYVLDRNLTPVPIGVSGELHIGGAGVAPGYLNQPILSAQKFILNPFSENPDLRLFKTGDLVRYRSDGHLEYVGRVDRQVKIRGFRVELDGIEAVLRKHPLVKDAAVVHEGVSLGKALVAYLVPNHGAKLNTADVKRFIRARLPEYMVPTEISVLDSLPVNGHGKIDRRALSAPDINSPRRSEMFTPPRTITEKRIARIWCEVLGLKDLGKDDHFFEIGGQSLLAAQIVSRIRKELQVEIPLRLIFEAPTVAQLAEYVDEALLRREVRTDGLAILSSSHGHEVPASQAQMRIWYMHMLAPESSAYNIAAPIRFTGLLHKEALTRSLAELIRRHESLRTTFLNKEGRPVQVISPTLIIEIPETDLRTIAEASRIREARRILSEEARRPFNLEKGPLIRVLLLQLGEEDQVLLLNMHHVISDQWSLRVIARELTVLYNEFCQSLSPSLNGLRPQYADFAMWQDQWLSRERLEAQITYWKSQLADLEPLALPTDYPRPSVQTFRGAYQSLNLSADLVESLRSHAAQENATLYMIFLAAFKVLLCRYTGRQDIAIGSPIANRTRLEWEEVVGTFINILVLRTGFSGNSSFRQVLRRVREVVLDGFTNGDAPFEMLVKELQPGRDASRSPLVQVLFNFQSAPIGKLDLLDLSWMPFEVDQSSSQFDVSVTVDPEITRKILIAYNTDLYKEETIARMLQHYQRLLESVAANPDQTVRAVTMLSDGERRQLLCEWNDTDIDVFQSCIHELFETQASKTPDSIAVVFEDQQISYRTLEHRANLVACRLREMGVKPEVLVGVCVERSTDLIVALLGILKAGGAYLPIDPAYPSERIAFMLEDSGTAVLLTQEKLLKQLPQNSHSIMCLDDITSVALSEVGKIPSLVYPCNLAYVIYTSGSTGKPKGVQVEHHSLVNFLQSMMKKPGISKRDVLLSVTTISFDIAALELFLPLTVGARVVLTTRETAADGRLLMQQIATSGATIMQATPTTWRMLQEAGWNGSGQLKILCGGESLPLDLAKGLLSGGNTVWNLYGPTETTVWSTACRVDPSSGLVLIGRPIDNTQIYILDSNMEPVPVGIPGEIFIGGQGVARGYLNRPELSAERFVGDPYGRDSNARLFKTGDLARYLPNGNIEYLGRMDEQLKIRGHRIEPGEVEATLRVHPAVSQAVVIGREHLSGETRLVAYLVPRPGMVFDCNELRTFLLGKLPNYMVPSAFVPMKALPIAPGGKVNRKGLASSDLCQSYFGDTFVPPQDRLEFQLAQIWQSVINVKSVSISDNFFALGGHSLTTVKLIAEIKKQLRIDIPIASVFAAPTIEQLARVIRSGGWTPPRNCVTEVRPGGSKPALFVIGGEHALARYLDRDQPIYGLSFLAMFETQITRVSLKEIAVGYVESIRTVQPNGPYYLAGYSSHGLVAFEMAQLLYSQGERIGLLALLDTYGPRSKRVSLLQTLQAHWKALKRSEPKERFNYLWKKAIFAVSGVQRIRWRIVHRSFLSGQPIPAQSTNLSMAYDIAIRNHVAHKYPGRGVLLRSSECAPGIYNDAARGWTGVLADGLEIHEITGDHMSMLYEPHVRKVAERLTECLRKAQLD